MNRLLLHICSVLFFLFAANYKICAQKIERDVAISAYIFNFAKNVQWQNEDSLTSFHFLIIGDDKGVENEMIVLSKKKTIRKKPIIISSSKTLKNIENVQLIFLAKGNEDMLEGIFDEIEGKNILLVSDGCLDKKLIMINFVDSEEGTLLFEINKANIINQHITIMPDMILLGGTTIDVAALYMEGQQSLRSLEKQIKRTDSLLALLEKANQMSNEELELNKDSLDELALKILEQKEFLETQSQLLAQREKEIDAQILKIKTQQQTLDAQSPVLKTQARELEKGLDSLFKQKKEIAEQTAKINQQKEAISNQTQILEKQGSTILRQRKIMYLLGVIALLVVILAFNIFSAYRNKKRMNVKLENKVAERTVDLNTANKLLKNELAERKLAEHALQMSEERFRHTLENMMEGCQIIGFDFRYLYVNDSVAVHGRKTKEELLGHTMMEVYPGIENTKVFEAISRCMKDRTPGHMINEFIYDNGTSNWFELSIQPAPEGVFVLSYDITERILAENNLSESEKRYRLLFERNPVPLLIYELGTLQMMAVNIAFYEHYGYTEDQIQDMKLPDLYPDEQKNAIAELTTRLHGHSYVGEWKHRKADGTLIDILATSNDITYKEKNCRIAVIKDISEWKKAEAEKQKTLSQLEAVFNANTDVVALIDAEGVFLGGNKALMERWGKKYDEIIGHSAREILPEHIFNSRLEKVRDVIKTKRSFRFTDTFNNNWFEVQITPVIEADGTVTMVAMYSQNITDRKNAEVALRESEEKYRTVIESATDSIVIIKNGMIQFINPALKNISGYSDTELLGNPFISFIASGDKERVAEYYGKRVRGEEAPPSYELLAIKKNGEEISFEITVTEFSFQGEKSELVFLHDITERKMIENRIKRMNEELEERVELRTKQLESANKELEAFAYSVSHDLRAPLRAISGFTKILVEDYSDKIEDEGQRVCGVIQNEATRMGQLIDDLLAFSRLSRTTMQTELYDMGEMVQQIFSTTQAQYENLNVEIIQGNLLPSCIDLSLMRQVWVNLISNAFKYSSRNETIKIEVGSYENPGEIVYFIKDNGAGFDMKYVDKLFGVFQRLHSPKDFPGTGVGLAIVQRIIFRHGGRIWAEGEINKGAKFYFTIPNKNESI